MTAFAPGGTSLAPDADYESAKFAEHGRGARGHRALSTPPRFEKRSRERSPPRARTSASSRRASRRARRRAISSRCSRWSTSSSPRLAATRARSRRGARGRSRARRTGASPRRRRSATSSSLFSTQNHRRRQPDDARGDPEGRPRQGLRLLQGPLRRRLGVHVRLRRQPRSRQDEGARRDATSARSPRTNRKETWRDVERAAAARGREEGGREGLGAEELRVAHVPRQGDLVARRGERHADARRGAPHPPARGAARGHGGRLRRERRRRRSRGGRSRSTASRSASAARRRTSTSSRRPSGTRSRRSRRTGSAPTTSRR